MFQTEGYPVIPIGTASDQAAVESAPDPDLSAYARIVVAFSGGADSVACVLHLLDLGADPERLELHHHLVDGNEGSNLMDWPITEAYCRAFARAFGLRLYFSWKIGGIEREATRQNVPTAPIAWERLDGSLGIGGGDSGKLGTRMKFPQVCASLMQRWCSAYCKVDVMSRMITSEPRFLDGKTLIVTGERAQESSSRARYKTYEPHRTDNRHGTRVRRHVDHWRPVHAWSKDKVWDLIRQFKVKAHPAYFAGYGRVSCRSCIFSSANQWATLMAFYPDAFEKIAEYEELFGVTIQRTECIRQLAARGTPYDADPKYIALAGSTHYDEAIIVEGQWELPAGALGESVGPT